jgi:hypothetical protein
LLSSDSFDRKLISVKIIDVRTVRGEGWGGGSEVFTTWAAPVSRPQSMNCLSDNAQRKLHNTIQPMDRRIIKKARLFAVVEIAKHPSPRWLTKATPLSAIQRDEDDERVGIGTRTK